MHHWSNIQGLWRYSTTIIIVGMHLQQLNQKSQHSEILSIASMEPFKYTFFVKRFLSRDDAMKRLELNNPNMNTELFSADPTVTVYVNEIDYPIIQYRLPSCMHLVIY